ncbi:tetratricopeptide repeat protein [Romeria aff. gracilis LEGE 07310]|uniref:Tetratricopeptide repeat protein n=1 Tax=Vasconcelosia minhoensis LEGE 07310 TaxID=915328 RepID=A0A8J7A7N6_9CYAN|nr:tetratricopeptide repeat protein [Romeria gracilis]MBE9078497.1 tetratricopeptide repeat protein [Romeria aff. gracilis LEGE 07310]
MIKSFGLSLAALLSVLTAEAGYAAQRMVEGERLLSLEQRQQWQPELLGSDEIGHSWKLEFRSAEFSNAISRLSRQKQAPDEQLQIPFEQNGVLEEGDHSTDSGALFDTYIFEGSAGQIVSITLESEEFDTLLFLLNSDNELIARNDDSGESSNSKLTVILPEAGRYIIGAAAPPGQAGSYQLTAQIGTETDLRQTEAAQLNQQGVAAYNRSDYPEALDYYQQALAIRQEIGDRRGEGTTLNNIGNVYSIIGDYNQALDYYQQALAIRQEISHLRGEGITLNNIGFIYSSLGNYSQALDYYQQALTINQRIGNRSLEGTNLNNIARIYDKFSDYSQALDYYQQALSIRQEIGDLRGEGTTLNNIGNVYSSLGDYSQALKYFRQALTIVQEIGYQRGEGSTLNNIGSIYDSLGDYSQALDYYQQALNISQRIGYQRGEGTTLNNIGSIYDSLGDYSQALDYYQQALNISQEIGDRSGEGTIFSNIGNIYSNLGDDSQALDYYQQALNISQEIGNRSGESTTLNSIGIVYSNLGDDSQALDYYQQALNISQEIGDRSGESITLNNIGIVYSNLGDDSQALGYYQQALAISQEIGDRSGEGTKLNNIGSIYYSLGDYSQALDYYEKALPILQEVGDRSTSAITLGNISQVLSNQQQPELAIVFLKQSVNTYESIRDGIRTLDSDLQSTYAESISDTYRTLADLLLQQDRILEAQRVLDLLKVQELDDYLQTVRGNAETASGVEYLQPEQTILARYQAAQEPAIELGQELATLNAKRENGTLTEEEEARRVELIDLQRELATQFNDFVASADIQALLDQLSRPELTQAVNLEDLSGLRDKLANLNAALLYPLILDDRIELVITTATSEPLRRTVEGVGRAELNAAITEFRQALQNPTSDATAPAQQLYAWLIEPLEADLAAAGVDTIIYSPDGALRYIPLAALHDGNQWLAERFRVNNITARSLTKLDTLPQNDPRVLAGAFVTGEYAVLGTSYSGLPFAGQEVELLSDTLSNITSFFDTDFNLETVENEIASFNILHFATHAAFVPGDPSESFILFGNGETQNLRDIASWQLANVDLVVLSACETGLGGFDNNGEQILGLGYQFQSRGAKAVVSSLWQVDDGGTQALMNAFYIALSNGHAKSEALRLAQQALIANDLTMVGAPRGAGIQVLDTETGEPRIQAGSLNHPYYWAPFILIGNGL